MKLAVVYDPQLPKLTSDGYSQTYRDMLMALMARYEQVQEVHTSMSADDIEADHIVFYDLHSSHHIELDGLNRHKAVKFEYFNDPHQWMQQGHYANGVQFHKLGIKDRCQRANKRGIQYAICPYEGGFYKYLAPHIEAELLWFPTAPKVHVEHLPILAKRRPEVVLSGNMWPGVYGFRPYAMRRWARTQPGVTTDTSGRGDSFQSMLSGYAAALALCDAFPVPKYLEVPAAGCLCLAQYQWEYEKKMGFKDGEHCLYVTKKNFQDVVAAVKSDPAAYQAIAGAGYELMTSRWTARHFAERIHGQRD